MNTILQGGIMISADVTTYCSICNNKLCERYIKMSLIILIFATPHVIF